MKVVYIGGPFRGPSAWEVEQNVARAESLAYAVTGFGAMFLCPHTNARHTIGMHTEAFWVAATLELLKRCDALLLTHDWTRSEGARGEHACAQQLHMPIFYSLDALADWLSGGEDSNR
jgi:hypothetical protein